MNIAFISCVKTKKNYKTIALELYDSDLFKKSLFYREGIINKLDNKCIVPLKGISFGNQLKFYKNNSHSQTLIFQL